MSLSVDTGNHGTATLEHHPDPLPHCLQTGAGGMGEVYLAQDTSELDRRVALKILPVEVAGDKNRLQRFTQEARTVSNLNHPNILTLYEFGQTESVCFMATEFVDGVTLRQHVSNRRLKLIDLHSTRKKSRRP